MVCSSFELAAGLLQQKSLDESMLCGLKEVLNTVNFSVVDEGEDVESLCDQQRHAARWLSMLNMSVEQLRTMLLPMTPPPSNLKSLKLTSSPMTPPSSGIMKSLKPTLNSPNLKEINNVDIETPEKAFLVKKCSGRVINDVHDVCAKNRESLSTVLSNVCFR